MESICCAVCFESYNYSFNKPLVLSCGHTFCNACIHVLIQSSPQCPKCKKRFLSRNIDMIPVNWEMLHMIDELDGKAVEKTSNIIFCKRHLTEAIKYLCSACNMWICDKCKVVDHQKTDCNVLDAKDAIKIEKKMIKSDLKEEKDCLETKVKELNEELDKLTAKHEVINIFLQELVERRSLFENLEKDVCPLDKTPSSIHKIIEIKEKLENFSIRKSAKKKILLSSHEEITHSLEVGTP